LREIYVLLFSRDMKRFTVTVNCIVFYELLQLFLLGIKERTLKISSLLLVGIA